MQKELIFITNIEKVLEEKQYYGYDASRKMVAIVVRFYYKAIEASATINTTETMTEEEIKDKIIEVLQ